MALRLIQEFSRSHWQRSNMLQHLPQQVEEK
jgi:hypothetical protein